MNRSQIANKLEELTGIGQSEKRVLINEWLQSENVESKEIEKILDDLNSYANY